jgi:hypothetical protein
VNFSIISFNEVNMAARTFSLVLITGGFLLYASAMAANVLLDPEGVFDTNLFPLSVNWNERNDALRRYKQTSSTTDGLLFSSSRGTFLDPDLLARNMGAAHLLSLSVSYGLMTDHLPIFEYIIRDKAARGQRINAVLLLLDLDFFGKQPWTNNSINSFLPPELTGEPPLRYWWRYLTAFQFRLWRDVVRAKLADPHLPKPVEEAINTVGRAEAAENTQKEGTPTPAVGVKSGALDKLALQGFRRSWNSIRPDLENQISKLERFVSLCRNNRIQLTIATSPMIRENLDLHEPGMLDALAERISKIAPLWDFNSPPLIASWREYWVDVSHFDSLVGKMMIGRMFGDSDVHVPLGFGRLRGDMAKPM